MSTTVQVLPNSTTNAHSVNDAHGAARPSQPRRNRPPKHRPATDESASLAEAAQSEGAASGSAPGRGRGRGGPTRGRGRPHENGQGKGQAHKEAASDSSGPPDVSTPSQSHPSRGGGRRGKFNARLTDPSASASTPAPTREAYTHPALAEGDLTSTLIDALRTPPYPDCPICFSSIHPAQPSWSCSPLTPLAPDESGEAVDAAAHVCWTTFHLKCVRAWAAKSVADIAAAWAARGEPRAGEWRCPGCQARRAALPGAYRCFCGRMPDPRPPRLATPHSCSGACGVPRTCGHPCPLPCHPGPCPPCGVSVSVPCHCGAHVRSFRCSRLAPGSREAQELSCGEVCGRKLGCGNHACADVCHPGPCAPCAVRTPARCFCGKEERELACGEGEIREAIVFSTDGREEHWTGRFACANPCERLFDCGTHACSKPCHTPSPTAAPCPRSPSRLTHCPCGKHALEPASAEFFRSGTRLARTACTDPIPTCTSTCMKPLPGCEHVCSTPCHTGPCPPCSTALVRPCRCGSVTRTVRCAAFTGGAAGDGGILCDKPCPALRACGRHRCNRVCCPLAALAGPAKGKGKKRAPAGAPQQEADDDTGLHACDLVCGKTLGCGNHTCEERDHRGACPPCLRSSFDELVCRCGRTVMMPPIPCGTRIRCTHPCDRALLECGHSRVPHACHEDPAPCPPCPFLTTKRCACGKKDVPNVQCAQAKVACGTPCGKLLGCGFHRCVRLCHAGECGACTSVCGKPRKHCLPDLHPCTAPCHAPSSCPETEPCMASVTLSCPCGRIQQQAPCGHCASSPSGRAGGTAVPKCTTECAVARRNARLAEALGITPTTTPGGAAAAAAYTDELQGAGRADRRFLTLVEKTFDDFVRGSRRTQVLPHMPPERRKFVIQLAGVYRMDTQMVDQEPQRSVQLIRRLDTRVPTPLLSAVIGTPPVSAASGLGRLATNMRGGPPLAPALVRPVAAAATSAPGAGRGWTAIVARAPGPAPAGSSPPAAVPAPLPIARLPSTAPVKASDIDTSADVAATPAEDVPDNWEDDV